MKRCFIVRHPFIPHVWVRHGARHEKQKTVSLLTGSGVSLLRETNAQLPNHDDRAMLRNQQEHGDGGTDDTLGFVGSDTISWVSNQRPRLQPHFYYEFCYYG